MKNNHESISIVIVNCQLKAEVSRFKDTDTVYFCLYDGGSDYLCGLFSFR